MEKGTLPPPVQRLSAAIPACPPCSSLNNAACMFLLLFPQHNNVVALCLHPRSSGWNMARYLNSLQGGLKMSFPSWHFLIPRQSVRSSHFPPTIPFVVLPASQFLFCVCVYTTSRVLAVSLGTWKNLTRLAGPAAGHRAGAVQPYLFRNDCLSTLEGLEALWSYTWLKARPASPIQ